MVSWLDGSRCVGVLGIVRELALQTAGSSEMQRGGLCHLCVLVLGGGCLAIARSWRVKFGYVATDPFLRHFHTGFDPEIPGHSCPARSSNGGRAHHSQLKSPKRRKRQLNHRARSKFLRALRTPTTHTLDSQVDGVPAFTAAHGRLGADAWFAVDGGGAVALAFGVVVGYEVAHFVCCSWVGLQ